MKPLRIAIIGAGPSGLFLFKKILDSGIGPSTIHLYEKTNNWGAGMPYSSEGARREHVTNVSANEIPHLVTTLDDWIHTVDRATLERFYIDPDKFHEYKVVPRLLFGLYLSSQFDMLRSKATSLNIPTEIFFNEEVTDISDDPHTQQITIISKQSHNTYDRVIICTGHVWPRKNENTTPNYFDSPYPPSKLATPFNHPVAIRGASLTAIDALQTLAVQHGSFRRKSDGFLSYSLYDDCSEFRMVMHSLQNMLPAVRFHVDDSSLGFGDRLSEEEIEVNRTQNDGFLSLDYVFEKNFKDKLAVKQPDFYEKIREMSIEEFVDLMMSTREQKDPFELLRLEYEAASKSIREHKSIYWKEALSELSYAMNYPAKYFSAEDMLRLKKTLMPLISIVIAFVPQSSAEEVMALHEAGVLSLVPVDKDSSVEPQSSGGIIYHFIDEQDQKHADHYEAFVDCTGQAALSFEDFPFRKLVQQKTVSPAMIQFRDNDKAKQLVEEGTKDIFKDVNENYHLRVPGVAINDNFQAVDENGDGNERIYIMAVPLIGGYNPDFSGLDFCDTASSLISKALH